MTSGKYVITKFDADRLCSVPLNGAFETIPAALAKIDRVQGRYQFPLMVDLASAFAVAGKPVSPARPVHHRCKSQMPA